jgi:excisionase family DNA binding protein
MIQYSTREAAQVLGVSMATINRYVAAGSIPVPPLTRVGGVKVRLWNHKDIAKAHAVLSGLAYGRRTRHRKTELPKKKMRKR